MLGSDSRSVLSFFPRSARVILAIPEASFFKTILIEPSCIPGIFRQQFLIVLKSTRVELSKFHGASDGTARFRFMPTVREPTLRYQTLDIIELFAQPFLTVCKRELANSRGVEYHGPIGQQMDRSMRGGVTTVQCLPDGGYGWHLGKNGSQRMHTHSVAIEVCNFSFAENGKTYVGTPIEREQLATLPEPFRGHQHWHAYSTKQIETLRLFILWIAERDSIDVRDGLVSEIHTRGSQAFEYNDDAYFGRVKGMWTHTNVRPDKFDLFPQEELMEMLLNL